MQTLDQKRAKYAWKQVEAHKSTEYRNLAKSAPALIMNNGLMQTLAFFHAKGQTHHDDLNLDLRLWLFQKKIVSGSEYAQTMNALFTSDSETYMRATDEALALLRWIRQFADTGESS